MSAKEKAKELFDKYSFVYIANYTSNFEVKQAAIIAVDEILNLMINVLKWDIKHNGNIEYWHEVKSEIKKIK